MTIHSTRAVSGRTRGSAMRAFTLIELLTVIAIVGVLAAILFSVIGSVRRSAKQSVNVSNVRQWTVANMLHMQDHKGYIPWRGPPLSGGEAIVDSMEIFSAEIPVLPWWNALPPYIGQPTLAELKAQGSLPRLGQDSIWVSPLAEDIHVANRWAAFTCYAPPRSSNRGSPVFVANGRTIQEPSRTVMFAETPHFSGALQGGVAYRHINEISSPNSTGPYNRNGSQANRGGETGKVALGFFDGSVRIYTGAQIVTHGVNTAAEKGNNPDRIVWRLDP